MTHIHSIVVMIARVRVTLIRAIMHGVLYSAFPCDCISTGNGIEMESILSDSIRSLKQSRGRGEVAATPAAASKPCT